MPKPSSADPTHDAFTRWWVEKVSGGDLPTPEQVKEFLPRLVREGLLLPEDRYVERAVGDLLAKGDPEAGVPPYDPQQELAAAARRGVDLSSDPSFQRLAELVEAGRARLSKRNERDPRRIKRARSAQLEKKLRKAAEASQKLRSKVLRSPSGKDAGRDRRIIQDIGGFLKVGLPVRLTNRKRYLVNPPPHFLSSKPTTATHDPVIVTPHWEKTTWPLRAMAFGIAAANRGASVFTLHLGDSGIAYGRGVGEIEFAQRLYRRIRDALKAKCPPAGYQPPEFFFVVEMGVGERPHLHGVIVLPDKKSHRTHLRAVLRQAVGTDWLPTPEAKTQLHIGSLYEPAGWISYISKYSEQTKESLGDNISACSRGLTQAGRQWYENARTSGDLLFPGKALPLRPGLRS